MIGRSVAGVPFPTLGVKRKEGTERCEAGIRQALVIPLDSCYVNKGLEYRGIKALGQCGGLGDLEVGVWNLLIGIWTLGFRFSLFGFRVWGLGFGLWIFIFRI